MAWRPYENVIEGVLDNTVLGKVTGYIKFYGMKKAVIFKLKGDFHRDIRGTKIKITGEGIDRNSVKFPDRDGSYMDGFCHIQKGDVGDMTAGLPIGHDKHGEPIYDYSDYPYFEWYSDNGRVVLELEPEQIEVIGTSIPVCESDPVDREKQHENMMGFLKNITVDLKNEREKTKK